MSAPTDAEVDQTLGTLLRWGVILATAVVCVGGALYLSRHGLEPRPDFHVFRGEKSVYNTIGGVGEQLANGSGRSIIQLGVLLLIATPIARVIFSIYVFGRQRDWVYVGVTVVVLAVLLYGVIS